MSKWVPGLDDRTLTPLRPLFVSPCHRWTSGSRFVDRTVLVCRDGLLYILNNKLEVTHSLLLRSPDLHMTICVEYEDNVLLGMNKGADGSKQYCVAISSSVKKATVLNWATFSLSERLGLEPDDGVVLAFSSSSVVADFIAAVSVFRQELEEKCRKAQEMLAKLGQKEGADDVLLQGTVDDFRIYKVAAGEVMKRAQAARSRSGVARHDAPALAKAGQLRYLPDGPHNKKKGLVRIHDIAQAAAQSSMGSPIRVDRPLGLRHCLRTATPWVALTRDTLGAPTEPSSHRYTGWFAKGIISSSSQ